MRNAFRPQTLFELLRRLRRWPATTPTSAWSCSPGEGPDAFCSGGDQRIRGDDGYMGDDEVARRGIGRLNVLDLQIQIRRLPKPVVAAVAGYAIGGGHILHLVCDLTIAADNARFGQTGPKVGSFDGGYGSGLLARTIGAEAGQGDLVPLPAVRRARRPSSGGWSTTVVPLDELEAETVAWCRQMLTLSPIALRMLKAGLNAADDGLAGIQQLAGDATMLFYMTEEGQEGRNAYVEHRRPGLLPLPQAPVTGPAPAAPARGRRWVVGARPRTLAAAGVPVLVGTAAGWWLRGAGQAGTAGVVTGQPIWWRAACALVVALGVQVGTNYANDYSDGVRGTDAGRVGPLRLVGSGLASPEAVRRAAVLLLRGGRRGRAGPGRRHHLVAAPDRGGLLRGRLALHRRPPPLRLPRPGRALRLRLLRGRGHGRLLLRAVPAPLGGGYDRLLPLWASVPVGLLATALLEANNLRDIAGDAVAKKRTLAVRLGRRRAGLALRRVAGRGGGRGRGRGRGAAVGAARPLGAGAGGRAAAARCSARPRAASCCRCSGGPAACSWWSAACSTLGILL